jgi:Rps23 Pro-64 3,4-dihydroxylase Tpa1-like proline 4-hydroxylase
MLNATLNLDACAEAFARDNRLRITGVLEPDIAAAVGESLRNAIDYQLMMYTGGQARTLDPAELQRMPVAQQRSLHAELMRNAGNGVGFLYESRPLNPDARESSKEFAALSEFVGWLNSSETLDMIGRISGCDDLKSADAQCTRYGPGHYLTRHRDRFENEERRLAYVFSFCPHWHPDWGGLLQFFEDDGTPRDAWVPGFNTLSLFDVRHVHSVTYVAPFAAAPRLSVTGWFRAA